MEPLRNGQPGPHECWDELAEHSLTHDDLRRTRRWPPRIRRGTGGQVRAYRDAQYALFRNGRYEQAAGIGEETPRYLDLNHRAHEAAQPLNRIQRWWHWQRTLGEEERDMTRLQRAAEQDNPHRRTR